MQSIFYEFLLLLFLWDVEMHYPWEWFFKIIIYICGLFTWPEYDSVFFLLHKNVEREPNWNVKAFQRKLDVSKPHWNKCDTGCQLST